MTHASKFDFSVERSFWSKRRVFLTGHTGFKGSWLVMWLSELGATVCGYSLAPEEDKTSMFSLLGLEARCDHVIGDVRDAQHLTNSLKTFRPDIVIHMAAQSLVRKSYREPEATFMVNVQGTVNVLEACRVSDTVRSVVSVTTDKCYRNREWQWSYREDDPLGGEDPYSASKAGAELATHAWRQSFFPALRHHEHGVALASARAGNVFGGGDWSEDRLLPDAVRAFTAGQPVTIRSPQSVRPWQFVLEPLAGYLMLARALHERGSEFAEAWNFGPRGDQILTVIEFIERFIAAWGGGAKWLHKPQPNAPHEAKLLLLDPGLANRRLGWNPSLSVSEALEATATWYKTRDDRDNLTALTLAQIDRFSSVVEK